jgi:sucrose-6-phosphate hydrolase SacC (GH32 family)
MSIMNTQTPNGNKVKANITIDKKLAPKIGILKDSEEQISRKIHKCPKNRWMNDANGRRFYCCSDPECDQKPK